jgi:transcriptional regulator with XRE-family HTH domain
MSTKIVCATDNYFADESDTILFPMKIHKKPPENLSDYVRRIAAEKGLSHVKIADRAKALGGTLSPGYVNSIIQGHVKSPKVETLQNLALGLGEPEEDLFEIARGKQLSDDAAFRLGVFAMLHRECQKLSEADKEAVKPFVELLKREIQNRV